MPYRRKCDDELIVERTVRIRADHRRGPLGPFRPFLSGFDPSVDTPFGPSDPSGRRYIAQALRRLRLHAPALDDIPDDAAQVEDDGLAIGVAEEWWRAGVGG